MKKHVLLLMLLAFCSKAFSQDTYYWIGNATGTWTLSSNWNKNLDGTGTSRNTPNAGDVLIFDGNNIGGTIPNTGLVTVTNVPYQTIASLVFRNAANVKFTTSPGTAGAGTTAAGAQVGSSGYFTGQTIAGTGTAFTSFFTVGDFISYGTSNIGAGGTNSIGQVTAITSDGSLTQSNGTLAMLATNGTSTFYIKDVMVRITNSLTVDATSKFEMASSTPFIFKINSGATGTVDGTVAITSNFQKLVVDAGGTASLTFNNGSKFQFTGTQSTAPFDAVANSTNNNVIFKYGSVYENNSTTTVSTNSAGSVFGAIIPNSVVDFQKGSTYIQNSTTASTLISNAHRSYPNVILNGATSGWQSLTIVDTLTVGASTTWSNTSNAYFPIKGDLIINGTYNGAATTPVFVFCGTVPQNLKVPGTIASPGGLNKIMVTAGSSLKLGNNITQATVAATGSWTRVYGSLDFDTYVINTASTGQAGVLQGYPTNTSVGTQTGCVVSASTPYLITTPLNLTGMSQGMQITGTGVPPNTFIVGTAGSVQIFTNNPIAAGTIDITSNVNPNGATFATANPAGFAASYPVTGTSTYLLSNNSAVTGPNYIFNAATTTPFPATGVNTSKGCNDTLVARNITFNAAVTMNKLRTNITGTLALGTGKLTIPALDSVIVTSGNAIAGTPGASKYIVTQTSGANRGVLGYTALNAGTVFPVGSATNYLPATITPTASDDYFVNVFEGLTIDGKPNGTAANAATKDRSVDAVWTINRTSGSTNAALVKLDWAASLEGTIFSGFSNLKTAISHYNGVDWDAATGSGDNTANYATSTFTSFSPFAVTESGGTLLVKFGEISASVNNGLVTVQWHTYLEENMDKYVIESSADGVSFGFKNATPAYNNGSLSNLYSFTDALPFNGASYYRIKAISKSGVVTYSPIVTITSNRKAIAGINVYPNPVVNKVLNLSSNNLPAGKYSLQLINNSGQVVLNRTLSVQENASSIFSISLPESLATGMYHLLMSGSEKQYVKEVLVK